MDSKELEGKKVAELKEMAKELGIKGISSMKKADLVAAISHPSRSPRLKRHPSLKKLSLSKLPSPKLKQHTSLRQHLRKKRQLKHHPSRSPSPNPSPKLKQHLRLKQPLRKKRQLKHHPSLRLSLSPNPSPHRHLSPSRNPRSKRSF
jgi:hypothetical protein